MGTFIYISNVDINEAGEHEAFLQHKTIGLSTDSSDFQEFSKTIKSKLPDYFSKMGLQSFQIYGDNLIELETMLKYALSDLIANKQEYPKEASADVRKILDKNIKLNLKSHEDKIISTFARILDIAENCRLQEKCMYFSIKS